MTPDYIIVGAGSAGCVLAERLTADGTANVLLIEAGPVDASPLIDMPKGFGKLLSDPRHAHFIPTMASRESPGEMWVRGKMLGGSSSINGMMYFRGHPEDYDEWAADGATGWSWADMAPAFGATEAALGISKGSEDGTWAKALIAAGAAMGIPHVDDLNHRGQFGIAGAPRTISGGKRRSAARAFLDPARRRPNVEIMTDVSIDRVLFAGARAVGVRSTDGRDFRTDGEVILSAGALFSPQILQRSGIGPAAYLSGLDIDIVADLPGVGANMLEHRLLMMHYRLNRPISTNRNLTGWRLPVSGLRYLLGRRGPLAQGSYEIGAFFKSDPSLAQPDCELLAAPYGYLIGPDGSPSVPDYPSFHMFGYPLRSRSKGSIRIKSSDPALPAEVEPNYLSDPYDCAVTVAMFRFLRALVSQQPLAELIAEELSPGPLLQSDSDIIEAFRTQGQAGYHACSTVRMGRDPDAPLDANLRVKGTDNLRVVDGSVMPSMPSANTNGPIMAIGWRAAQIIQKERRQ